ncbi:MAG: nuclear transport factor 2 family protein [Polyangiaceae bacterium]
MSNVEIVQGVYDAFAAGDVPKVLGAMHGDIKWIESAGYKFGGVYNGPQAVLEGVLGPTAGSFESFGVEITRLIDAGDTIVMQGHYAATGKNGKSVRAGVVHVIGMVDGKIKTFEQYVDSATINPLLEG